MPSQDWELIGTLKTLFESCKDAEEGYRMAARHADNAELKGMCERYAEQRAQYASALEAELATLDSQPTKMGTISGGLRQGWVSLKDAVTGGSDQAVIDECERGEDAAKRAYEETLAKDLPAPVRALVEGQLWGVREAHYRMRALQLAAK